MWHFFLQEASIQPSLTALLRFVNHFEACSNGSLQRYSVLHCSRVLCTTQVLVNLLGLRSGDHSYDLTTDPSVSNASAKTSAPNPKFSYLPTTTGCSVKSCKHQCWHAGAGVASNGECEIAMQKNNADQYRAPASSDQVNGSDLWGMKQSQERARLKTRT